MRVRLFHVLLIFAVTIGVTATSLPAKSLPLEAISLLCDREVYLSGEILYFSANVTQSSPTEVPLSTTLYLEILDGNGRSVVAQKHEIAAGGHSHGSMELSSILPTGAYFVRAYTQYQKNLPPASHTTQLILIVNPDEGVASIPSAIESPVSYRFDSGVPIAGLSTLMVVRTNRAGPLKVVNGQGVPTGELLHEVGGFQLWEVAIEAYETLRIESPDSTRKIPSISFPAASQEGILASINTTESIISAVFYPAPANMTMSSTAYQVEFYDQNFQLVTRHSHDLKTDGFRFSCPRTMEGFSERYMLLRSDQGKVVYAGSVPKGSPLSSDSPQRPGRFAARTEGVLPVDGSSESPFAISIRKKIPIPAQMMLDIAWTNPWLIPQLTIPDSLQTFTNVLFQEYLATKGLEQFGKRSDDWLPESRDMGISGIIRTTQTEIPAEGVLVVVSVVGEDPQIHPQTTDNRGRFEVPLRNLSGAETIFLGMKEPSGLDLTMVVNRDFSPEVPAIRPVPFTAEESFHQLIEELYVSLQVSTKYQQPPVQEILPAHHIPALPTNLSTPDVSVKVADYIDLPSVEELILNVIPKVSLDTSGDEIRMNVYEDRTLAIHEDPLVLLDYAVVFDLEALLELSPAKLSQFDIYQGEYFLGDHKFTGIVSILTHTDDFARYPFDEYGAFVQLSTIQPDAGVSTADTEEVPASVPDFRPVLYWHPAKKGGISFRTSDWEGEYEVVIQYSGDAGEVLERKEFTVERRMEN